jgi:hypothetical protein
MTKERLAELKELGIFVASTGTFHLAIRELIKHIEELEKERDYLIDTVNGLESNLGDAISGKFFTGSRK